MTRNLVTEEGLLEVVPLTHRQVRELRDRHKIPYIKFGHRSVMYNIQKVLAALEKLEIKKVS
jgi:aspartate/tyrosine/aromatic aminotransferase